MSLVTTKEMFEKAYKGKYAIGAFNVDNMDIMKAVLNACEKKQSPVIIAISSGALKFIGEEYIKELLVSSTKKYSIPIALHLDHGKSVELCKKCVDLGFTSVMIDASAYDFETNIKMTKEVVEYAHAHGVVVESELGSITGIEDDSTVEDKYGHFTHPDQVVEFVNRTGIDSLAVAIGTAHGAFKYKPDENPALRFDILEEIERKLPGFPLVLHGSSSVPKERLALVNQYGGKLQEAKGIPEDMLREASKRAVCKINVGTDLRVCWTGEVRKFFATFPEEFEIRKYTTPARNAVKEMVKDKMKNVFMSSGKAVVE